MSRDYLFPAVSISALLLPLVNRDDKPITLAKGSEYRQRTNAYQVLEDWFQVPEHYQQEEVEAYQVG